MAEYIKREDVLNALCNDCVWRISDCNMGWRCEESKILLKIPSADVRENVRGVWKLIPSNISITQVSMVVECSKCGVKRDRLVGDVLNYCPHCGADMRV